uniref:Putative secreted protein n=1 Tax=Anopheles darlingi TaxID=43151 RepID=A0A2M4DPZ7_ANODA
MRAYRILPSRILFASVSIVTGWTRYSNVPWMGVLCWNSSSCCLHQLRKSCRRNCSCSRVPTAHQEMPVATIVIQSSLVRSKSCAKRHFDRRSN